MVVGAKRSIRSLYKRISYLQRYFAKNDEKSTRRKQQQQQQHWRETDDTNNPFLGF